MLTLPPSVRIYVAAQPVDIRKAMDGLSGAVREILRQNPMSGHLFAFRNRRGDRMKILYWDRSGYCLFYNQRSSHYTSSAWMGASSDSLALSWKTAARSTSRFHRLHCLVGGLSPGCS